MQEKRLRMIKRFRRFSAHNEQSTQEHQADELLQALLQAPAPDTSSMLRPVALRSKKRQRRQVLGSYLLRNWFDHFLRHTERVLTLALIGFFMFWLLDGYGRDWLHEWQQRKATASGTSEQYVGPPLLNGMLTLNTTSAMSLTMFAGSSFEGNEQTPSLPFTPAAAEAMPDEQQDTAAAPDYIAPNYLVPPDIQRRPQTAIDPRPQRLVISAIEVDTPVTEVYIQDHVWQVAEYAAGYHHGSALPGDTGNTVMAGHAGLRGAVFRDLGKLQAGDEILVEAGGWRYRYRVRGSISVWPTQTEVMNQTPTPVLTLITCTAWDTQRLVVIADLVDSHPL
jgi:sortase A